MKGRKRLVAVDTSGLLLGVVVHAADIQDADGARGLLRRLLDGLFYLVRTGCQWRHLPPPPAFPPWRTVYGYMRAFEDAGVWEVIRHRLVVMLREREGREPSPTAAIVDTQSAETTEKGGLAATTPPRR